MREELDKLLCERYPKIFRDRYAAPSQTCMYWGIDCGDGWFDLLDTLCHTIQSHIDHTRRQRTRDLRFNRALGRALQGDTTRLMAYFGYRAGDGDKAREWAKKRVAEVMAGPEPQAKIPKVACPQVVAAQVKEKFGTLRFYYDGGDDFVYGAVAVAETMSGMLCEDCGAPGVLRPGRWVRTLCNHHAGIPDATTVPATSLHRPVNGP